MAEFTLLEWIREVIVSNKYIELKESRSYHDPDTTTPHVMEVNSFSVRQYSLGVIRNCLKYHPSLVMS